MAVFTSSAQRIPIGPGTLYVAPLGTTEPTSISGAWPANWVALGYTDKGNDVSWKPTFQAIEVDEELMPVRQVPSAYEGSVGFSLAEITAQNYLVTLNAGIGSALDAVATGTNPDGSIWVEPPAFGAEVHLMVGWDAAVEGAAPTGASSFLGRAIYRECVNTGEVKWTHQKGNNKWVLPIMFSFIKPATGLQPFREILPSSVAA